MFSVYVRFLILKYTAISNPAIANATSNPGGVGVGVVAGVGESVGVGVSDGIGVCVGVGVGGTLSHFAEFSINFRCISALSMSSISKA